MSDESIAQEARAHQICQAGSHGGGYDYEDDEGIQPSEGDVLEDIAFALSHGDMLKVEDVEEAAYGVWREEVDADSGPCPETWIQRQIAEVYALAAVYMGFDRQRLPVAFGEKEFDRQLGLINVAIREMDEVARSERSARDILRLADLIYFRTEIHVFRGDIDSALRDVGNTVFLASATSRG